MSFPYMPLYVGDYLKDTNNFSAEEHGAYLLLIFDLWNAGGTLAADPEDLRIRARVTRRKWPAVWYKLAPKFTVSEGRIEHRRVTSELQKARTKSEVYRNAGKRSAKVRALKTKGVVSTSVEQTLEPTFNKSESEPVVEPIEGSTTGDEADNVVTLRPRAMGRGASAPLGRNKREAELAALRQELESMDRVFAKYPETRSPERERRASELALSIALIERGDV